MKKCKKHPKYKALQFPTSKCEDCRNIWLNSEKGEDWQSFFDELKKGSIWEEDSFLKMLSRSTKDKKLKSICDQLLDYYDKLTVVESEANELCSKFLFHEEDEEV